MMTTLQLAAPPPATPAINAPLSRVLLAVDFGSASLGAARWATTHIASGADAVLMHVMPSSDDVIDSHAMSISDDDSLERMMPALRGGLGGFAATLDVASCRSVVRVGRPSACLAAIANGAEIGLLVLGRRSDASRIRVGEPNVIERAARRTGASVLVVPEGTNRAPEHVIAAVDESRFASHVLRVASRLARMHELPLTVLHVLSPVVGAYERVLRSAKHLLPGDAPHAKPARPFIIPGATRWLAQLGREHGMSGRDSTEVVSGDPARAIVRMAMDREASLVVVGMRGADETPPGSIGSVVRELLTRGPTPVLAVNAV
jgi:nucleotide-binding universal stress UspA family protein